MKKNRFVILFLCLTVFAIQGQQSTVAAGGVATGAGGSVTYSIGQTVYKYISNSDIIVAQGVQQPYEIAMLSVVEDTFNTIKIEVYPNPTTSYLIINIQNNELSDLNFQLFNVMGKLIEQKKITSLNEILSLDNMPCSTYFLKVFSDKNEIKLFKIIKK